MGKQKSFFKLEGKNLTKQQSLDGNKSFGLLENFFFFKYNTKKIV